MISHFTNHIRFLPILFLVLIGSVGCSFLDQMMPTPNIVQKDEFTTILPGQTIVHTASIGTTTIELQATDVFLTATTEDLQTSESSDESETTDFNTNSTNSSVTPIPESFVTTTPLPNYDLIVSTETVTVEPAATVTISPEPTSTPQLRYVFPIQPPDLAWFNDGHHDYPATDIGAPLRVAFVAVTDGTIDELSRVDQWESSTNDPALRGGRYVSLIGDDGIRYYGSHLDEVAIWISPGMHVSAGTVLGFVGNSGNARGLTWHLHFGISKPTYPGDWQVRRGQVNPFPYLQAWLNGESVTPNLEEVP
jgi:peptidoglycan LD-endopeptidase LytH